MSAQRVLTLALAVGLFGIPLARSQQTDPSMAPSPPQQRLYYSSLPAQPIGANDLIGISVYDSPGLSGPVRVDSHGMIRLPMLQKPILASGLYPAQLETAVEAALIKEDILVNPIVTVTIMEYQSRPVSVMGAVKNPLVFQASQPTTLMEALARAGGLTEMAGPDILVTHTEAEQDGKPIQTTQKIATRDLIDLADPSLNIVLQPGDQVLVPQARMIYVLGDVQKPGGFPIQNNGDATALKMIALAGGLAPDSRKVAFVFRKDSSGSKQEIPIELAKILKRKAPDVRLMPNDILYIPDNNGKRVSMKMLESLMPAAAAASIYGAFAY